MMPRHVVEQILPTLSLQDREQALKCLEHSCSFYDQIGNHIPHDYEKEKEGLLEVIAQRDCYVIDNNSFWQKEYPKPENHGKAFIISPALAREYANSNTNSLLLDKDRYKYGNLFSVGILILDSGQPMIMVDRLDEHMRYVFNLPALKEASRQKGQTYLDEAANFRKNMELIKRDVREALKIKNASELPPPEDPHLTLVAGYLKQFIQQKATQCRHNFPIAHRVSSLCHAVLLIEDPEIRKEFDMPVSEYPNVFGDMFILLTALFLKAKILTHDNGLIRMASYANIVCHHVPR